MVHDQWLRMQVLGIEVPGSNSGNFFDIFCTPFLPHGDCSIRVSRSRDFILAWVLLYNFVAVTLLLFKLSKDTATMINLYLHTNCQVISILGLPCIRDRSLIIFYVNKCPEYSSDSQQTWYVNPPLHALHLCQRSRQSSYTFAFYSNFCKVCEKKSKPLYGIRRKKRRN